MRPTTTAACSRSGRTASCTSASATADRANDPPNNAQNVNVLLGKILRIDVDRVDPVLGNRYSAPPDNPFVNAPGRDEIFAFGLRNPWRFSFDRANGALWVGDVGQGQREEVNAPVVKGGNYGWRVYEGTACTNNDPTLCNPPGFTFPLFEYGHSLGRCSVTGGYVYRGSRGALAAGTYVYGDFCSGEIFAWDGSAQSLLLDTSMSIASFGEDEQGELYVVDIGGTMSRIAAKRRPMSRSSTSTPVSDITSQPRCLRRSRHWTAERSPAGRGPDSRSASIRRVLRATPTCAGSSARVLRRRARISTRRSRVNAGS